MAERLRDAIRADHALLVSSRLRYDDRFTADSDDVGPNQVAAAESPASWTSIIADIVTNVGFQQLTVFRLANALHHRGITPLAMLTSRAIRHMYAAEMHYAATVAPGVLIVHGNGLVVSRAARIDRGCVLSQNVTLGISTGVDADGVRTSGAPHLCEGVHIAPGAVLVGPITVGERSKVAPNTTVLESVPPATVVSAAPSLMHSRAAAGPLRGVAT